MRTRAIIIEKAMEYLAHKHLYGKAGPRDEVPDFQERIPPDIALELWVSATLCHTLAHRHTQTDGCRFPRRQAAESISPTITDLSRDFYSMSIYCIPCSIPAVW